MNESLLQTKLALCSGRSDYEGQIRAERAILLVKRMKQRFGQYWE